MSERYSRLFALPAPIYAMGAPVVIMAGALLKDNQTGKVLAQLKIQNISDKAVKAATVKLEPLDPIGEPLGEAVDFQYLDLNIARDMEFGQKTPIVLPDAAARGFRVSVSDAYFVDNTAWTSSGAPWEPLPAPVTLEQALGEKELAKQYRLEHGNDCKFMFRGEKDLWWCPCGALNHKGEPRCHQCRKEAAVLAALDLDQLRASRDERLEAERQQEEGRRAAAFQRAEEKRAKTEKRKKTALIVTPIAVIAVAAVMLISSYISKVQKANDYHSGLAALEAGNYSEAVELFEGLGDYEDSPELLQEAQTQKANAENYAEAIECMESETYGRAVQLFEELGDYKDSKEQLAVAKEMYEKESLYQETLDILDRLNEDLGYPDAGDTYKTPAEEEYYELSSQAYKNLTNLSGYKDADQLLEHFRKTIIGTRGGAYYGYDSDGTITSQGSTSFRYSYNEDGLLTEYRVGTSSIYKFTDYDSSGRPVRAERTSLTGPEYSYQIYTYAYDSNGRLIQEERRYKFVEDWAQENWDKYVYDYNEDGWLIKRTQTDGFSDIPEVTTYGYEDEGTVLLEGDLTYLIDWVYMP